MHNCNSSFKNDIFCGTWRLNLFLKRWPKCNKFFLHVWFCNVSLSQEQVSDCKWDSGWHQRSLQYPLLPLGPAECHTLGLYHQLFAINTSLRTMRWSPGRCRGCDWPRTTGLATCWSSPHLPAPRRHLRLRSPPSWAAVTVNLRAAVLTTAPAAPCLPPLTSTPPRRRRGRPHASPSFGRTSSIASLEVSWRLHMVNDVFHVSDNQLSLI